MVQIDDSSLRLEIEHIKELSKLPNPAVYKIYLLGVKHGLQAILGKGPFSTDRGEDSVEMRDLIVDLLEDIFPEK